MRVAVVQMCSGNVKESNVSKAEGFITQAARSGAKVVALPEHFNFRGASIVEKPANVEPIPGPTSKWAQDLAQELGIYLLAGGILERSNGICVTHGGVGALPPRPRSSTGGTPTLAN